MNSTSIFRIKRKISNLNAAQQEVSDCLCSTVTVLMCDIVSSTHLSTTLPVEVFRSLLLEYYRVCDDIIRKHSGRTMQYAGDGILSVFGEPFGEKATALDAVRAGLSICQQEFIHLDQPYEIRVAACTGEIATGTLSASRVGVQNAVFGTTPWLVERLQSIAPPRTLFVDQSTFEKIDVSFKTRWVGLQNLKGFEQEIPAWQVRGEKLRSDCTFSDPIMFLKPLKVI